MSGVSLSSWLNLAVDAATLKPEPFQRFGFGAPSLRQAVLLVVVVGLIVGAVGALTGIPALLRPAAFSAEEFITEFNRSFERFQPFGGAADANMQVFLDMYRRSFETFAPFIEELNQVPAPLPGIFGRLFEWLGAWLSTPFSLLGRWLGISIWIMLFARLLGGRGALLSYLGASSLSVIPHLLGVFSFIPFLGGILGFAASIWGLAIQARAVQITHDLSPARAVTAVLLPFVLLFLLAAVVAVVLAILLFSAVAAASA